MEVKRHPLWWPPEEEDQLRQFAAQWLSCSKIGEAMGRTKNSIVGKMKRMGINYGDKKPVDKSSPAPNSPIQTKLVRARQERLTERKVMPIEKPIAEGSRGTRKFDASPGVECEPRRGVGAGPAHRDLGPQDCKWPYNDPLSEDFFFCSAPRMIGSPYCARHTKLGTGTLRPLKKEDGPKREPGAI